MFERSTASTSICSSLPPPRQRKTYNPTARKNKAQNRKPEMNRINQEEHEEKEGKAIQLDQKAAYDGLPFFSASAEDAHAEAHPAFTDTAFTGPRVFITIDIV
jgi:hypothetical protein